VPIGTPPSCQLLQFFQGVGPVSGGSHFGADSQIAALSEIGVSTAQGEARIRSALAGTGCHRGCGNTQPSPSAAILDSQSVKTTEAGGPRGYDAEKKINGRKRHALVDTDGRGLVLESHPASIQDRDGGCPMLSLSRQSFPFIERVFADGGYAGERSPRPL
jgi:Transposase DDE domain